MAKHDDDGTESKVGYGKPPKETRFQPGKSGNPKGRPRGAKDRRSVVKRVLLEKHKADPTGTGRARKITVIECLVLILKQLCASGDERAFKVYQDLLREFGEQEPTRPGGYLVLPEINSMEEWLERFGADRKRTK